MMGDRVVLASTVAAAVGSGLVAGLMFAFSACVMRALARRPAPQGIAAMQAMNAAILNPVFGLLFAGTTVTALGSGIAAPLTDGAGSRWSGLGSVLFLVGVFVVTMVRNVPLNNSLEDVDPADPDSTAIWARYVARWTRWNHLRTLAATAAATAFTLALV